jgi:hypothetical protein
LVNCEVANKWVSSQWVAAASQKFTWPTVTGVIPAFTVAVSVTTLPETTVVTTLPSELTASVVVVTTCAAAATERAPTRRSRASLPVMRAAGSFRFPLQLVRLNVMAMKAENDCATA